MILYLKGLIHEYNWVKLATALKYNAVQLYLLVDMVDKIDAYHIFVIFFTRAKFLENKIYTENRQFFALNL